LIDRETSSHVDKRKSEQEVTETYRLKTNRTTGKEVDKKEIVADRTTDERSNIQTQKDKNTGRQIYRQLDK
jgi:hypothetical protein